MVQNGPKMKESPKKMNLARIKTPAIYASAALILSMPSILDFRHQHYSTIKHSHTAMLNEEAHLKQRRHEVSQEIHDLQHRLDQKHKQLDTISARLAALQIAIKDLERQL